MDTLAKIVGSGFVPILVKDNLDPVSMCELVVEAGIPAVEFTLRRDDLEKIPLVRKEFPGLILLAGSVIDEPLMVRFLKEKRRFHSVEELCDFGVDGFVSITPFRKATYRKFAGKTLFVPGVSSPGEALSNLACGAHLAKFVNVTDGYLKAMQAATHSLIPAFYSGGVTPGRIGSLVENGVMVSGVGFDVLLGYRYGTMQRRRDRKYILERLQLYRESVARARNKRGETFYGASKGKVLLKATGRYFSCL